MNTTLVVTGCPVNNSLLLDLEQKLESIKIKIRKDFSSNRPYDLNNLLKSLDDIIDGRFENNKSIKPHLALACNESLIIPPVDGKRSIARSVSIFSGGMTGYYKSLYLDLPSQPTTEVSVSIRKITDYDSYMGMFTTICKDINELCLTQHQIVEFCRLHTGWMISNKLITRSWQSTCFLFKQNNEFYVANTQLCDDGIYIFLDQMNSACLGNNCNTGLVVIPSLS